MVALAPVVHLVFREGEIMINRILFPTDFGQTSARAQEVVIELAKSLDAEVLVLHAVEPIQGFDDEQDPTVQDFLEGLRKTSVERASQTCEHLAVAGVRCDARVLIGVRWREIVHIAESEAFDLIVLGAHRRDLSGKHALGSTSHRVFLISNCPVMAVPAD